MKIPCSIICFLIPCCSFVSVVSCWGQAPQPPKIQVVQLEKLEINDGLITDEIAKRFNSKFKKPVTMGKVSRNDRIEVGNNEISRQTSVKVETTTDTTEIDKLKGAFASTLAQEMSATKLMQLAVRDKSLESLKKEWQVSEELGKPVTEGSVDGGPDMSVQQADYIAIAKINDFVTDRKVFGSEEAAIWTNSISATLEITKVNGGTKKVITETVADGGKGRRGVGGEAANFNAQQIQNITQKLSKRLAERILDNYSPPKIIAHRGALIIMDRGQAAGVNVGDTYKLIERVDSTYGTDAGFPFGNATVEFVNEDTANLRLDPSVPEFGPEEMAKITLQKNTK